MTVISANQPQLLEASQLKIQFHGLGKRSYIGINLSGERSLLEADTDLREVANFLRFGSGTFEVLIDLNRAAQKHKDIRFYAEAGAGESVSWTVESLHDSTSFQSEGVSLESGDTMTILTFLLEDEDWQISSLEELESSSTAKAQTVNPEIPSSIQELEMLARSGGSKSQKFSKVQVLIDTTISMKSQILNHRLLNLLGAIQAMGMASGATSIEVSLGGVIKIDQDISEDLEASFKASLEDPSLWSGSAVSLRNILPDAASAQKKSKIYVLTDGYFMISDETLARIESTGHSVEVLILDSDGLIVNMPASSALRFLEIEPSLESGKDFLNQISS